MRTHPTTPAEINAFLAKRSIKKVGISATGRNTPIDTRRTIDEDRAVVRKVSRDHSRMGYCEDAPCCGCCDPRIGMKRGVVR